MKTPRFIFLFLFLVSLTSIARGQYDDGTITIVQSAGSCSGPQYINRTLTDEELEADFISGQPVGIPSPISPSSNGINPISVVFEEVNEETGEVVGTLSAETVDHVERYVSLIINEEFVDTQFASSGQVSFILYEGDLSESMALVVLSENSRPGEVYAVSRPTIIIVNPPEDQFDDFTVTVNITNVDADTSENPATLLDSRIALSTSENVAFSANNPNDQRFVGIINFNSGLNDILTTDTTNGLDQLTYSGETLLGRDPVDGLLYTVTPNGVGVSIDSIDVATPANRSFCVSPDGNWIASNVEIEDSSHGLLIDSLTSDTAFSGVLAGPEDSITGIECSWLDNDSLAISKSLADGTYTLQQYDVADILSGDSLAITPTTLVAATTDVITAPRADTANANRVIYECTDDATLAQIDLCLWSAAGTQTLFNDTGVVENARFNIDGSGIFFELDTSSGSDDLSAHSLVFINTDTMEATYLLAGLKPHPSPTDKDIMVYLNPVSGALQVGIVNLRNLPLFQ